MALHALVLMLLLVVLILLLHLHDLILGVAWRLLWILRHRVILGLLVQALLLLAPVFPGVLLLLVVGQHSRILHVLVGKGVRVGSRGRELYELVVRSGRFVLVGALGRNPLRLLRLKKHLAVFVRDRFMRVVHSVGMLVWKLAVRLEAFAVLDA